jgi:hypothetical protein
MTRVCFTLVLGAVLVAGALSVVMPSILYSSRVKAGHRRNRRLYCRFRDTYTTRLRM